MFENFKNSKFLRIFGFLLFLTNTSLYYFLAVIYLFQYWIDLNKQIYKQVRGNVVFFLS